MILALVISTIVFSARISRYFVIGLQFCIPLSMAYVPGKRKRFNLNLNLAEIPEKKKKTKKKKKEIVEEAKSENAGTEEGRDELEINPEDEFEPIEDHQKDESDPFRRHLNPELSPELHNALLAKPPKLKKETAEWPNLGKLVYFYPDVASDQVSTDALKESDLLSEDQPLATPPKLPRPPKDLSLDGLHIKPQILFNLEHYFSTGDRSLTHFQRELLELMSNYHDVYYPEANMSNHSQIRQMYCLHAANHAAKTRQQIVNNNEKLKKRSSSGDVPEEFRDQGLVRPRILIIVPFKSVALRIVLDLAFILLGEKGRIHKQTRFVEDYSGDSLELPDSHPKPEDYVQLFSGNTSDDFKIGITITRRSIKLYSYFYESDIIIASPLGLRTMIGAEGEEQRDYDFLSSIELLIMDQAHVFTVQNWEHVTHLMEHLHLQPKRAHDSDLSRARSWALNGWSKYYMQCLVFADHPLVELSALVCGRLHNYGGKVIVNNPVITGSISQVVVPIPQMFHYISCDSVTDTIDARFQAFKSTILPRFKEGDMKHTLVYVPSYFDFVRLRNFCKKQELKFVQICEYTEDRKITRARNKLFHGDTQFLLYTERFHFYRRIFVRGIKHIVFYQPPAFPHFYSEIANFLQDSIVRLSGSDQVEMSIDVLYTKYDAPSLAGIIGTERTTRILASQKTLHVFSTENSTET